MSGHDDMRGEARETGLPPDFRRGRVRLWLALLAMAAVTATWMRLAGLALDPAGAAPPALACLGLEALATFYLSRRPEPNFAVTLSGLAQILGFSACAGALSYAAAATGGPLWDGTFLAADRALGLDWRAYLDFLDARPALGFALSLAYRSLMAQTVLVLVVLGFTGRLGALREFVLAFAMAGAATVLLSALTPAMAMFVHLGLRPEDFPGLDPAAAYVHLAPLSALRDGSLRILSLSEIEGIVTFPSFHAALGVLFARSFWLCPATRWPGLVLNGMLLAATPVDGGHYFVDVGAGVGIALASIAAARRAYRPRPFAGRPEAASGAIASPAP